MKAARFSERYGSSSHGFLWAGFICLGIFLRLYNFWQLDLWRDEYRTSWVIANGWSEVVERTFQSEGHSPLYLFVVQLSSDLFGTGPAALRLPSILFSIGILGLAYPLAIRLFNDRHVALLATAAFAVNELLIFYAQEARPYSLAMLFTMASFLFYLSLLSAEKRSYRIGYLLATAGAYYAHYVFGSVALIQVLHLLLTRGWSWLRSKAWIKSFLILTFVSLPGSAQILLFTRRGGLDWVKHPRLLDPVELAFDCLGSWSFFAGAAMVLAFAIVDRKKIKPAYRSLDLVALWFLAPILFVATLPSFFGVSLFHYRFVLPAVLAGLFFVAWLLGLDNRTAWSRWLPVIVFLTMNFISNLIPALRTAGTFAERPDEGWKKAASFLERNAEAGDLILFGTGFIEADYLSVTPDPVVFSFIRWPLAANLSSSDKYRMAALPRSEATTAYLTSVLEKAAENRRVWVVGKGRVIDTTVQALRSSQRRFRTRERELYGNVHLILLER
jgi:4-amino-4-deoxy-L-arabinose transferase-like glycosyltransferase